MDDEIKLRAGLDTTDFDRAESSMRGRIGQFGEHGHRSFLHASSGAKELHKAVHEIGSEVGILGKAFTFLTTPIGGFLSIATAGFVYLNEKLTEMNKNLSEQGSLAAKPIGNIAAILKSGQLAIEGFNNKFNEWKYAPAKDKTTENLEKKLAVLKAIEQHAIQTGGDKTAIEKASAQAQMKLQSETINALKGGAGESGKAADMWAGEMRKSLGNPLIGNATANIKTEEARLEILRKQEGEIRNKIETIRNPGPGSEWYFQSQTARNRQADSMEHTALNPVLKQMAGIQSLIDENQSKIDRETHNRGSIADRVKFFQTQRDERLAQAAAITNAREQTALRLDALNGGSGVDTRSPQTKAVDDWVQGRAAAQQAWMDSREKAQKDFIHRLTPFAKEPVGNTPEGFLKQISDKLDELNKLISGGIKVEGTE